MNCFDPSQLTRLPIKGDEDVGQRPPRGDVLRRGEAPLPYQGQAQEEGEFWKTNLLQSSQIKPNKHYFHVFAENFSGEQTSYYLMAGVDKPVRHCPYWPS